MQKKYCWTPETVFDCINVNHYSGESSFLSLPAGLTDVIDPRDSAPRIRPDFRGFPVPQARPAGSYGRVGTEPLRGLARAARAALRHHGSRHVASVVSAGVCRHLRALLCRGIPADSRRAPAERPAPG